MSDVRITQRERCYDGKWLFMENVQWENAQGRQHIWESVSRTGRQNAAVVVPCCKQSGDLILIKQFRPPVGSWVLEFPAGLIDEGESAEACALRELKEETGYAATLVSKQGPLTISPGLTDERVTLVCVEIDEDAPENLSPQPAHEGSESIEVLKCSLKDLKALIENPSHGLEVDVKLATWLLGSQQG